MKELIFNDGRKTEVQSVSTSGGIMHVRMILTTSEQLKAYFMDEFATSVMTLRENGKETKYESYTELQYIKEEDGGIWEVEMRQTQADTETRLTELENGAVKTEEEIEQLKEEIASGGAGVDPALFSASVVVARANAQALDDSEALQAKVLYKSFDELVEAGYTAEEQGYKFRDGDDLWKTAKDNVKFEKQYRPGTGTESLYTRINESHAGTKEDPIPAQANMEYEYGKYYIENDTTYLCKRGGILNPEELYGQKVTLQYLPSALVGQYFEIVEE